jgi:hypothetical protein
MGEVEKKRRPSKRNELTKYIRRWAIDPSEFIGQLPFGVFIVG